MISVASFLSFPCDTQPGKAGHLTTIGQQARYVQERNPGYQRTFFHQWRSHLQPTTTFLVKYTKYIGMGYSLHAGQVIVADGTDEMDARLNSVLTNDPGMGIYRHADAGYNDAIDNAKKWNVDIPMMD